ncbi:hypothetical protein P168DRAFT_313917 [Aspergillus campestris IBT 28561]|uniref:Uncharacterized protein n=1 Tax=Aspergillus campestris (strain IBT 28561) TaxID=1392248 RepID=A0A2I1DD33_ASPC2|nr:uncharacterized protein P168DRAFT_313917 [Aspergillus campestris IBT 28561]PKY07771.1 hypothetical protein P168DRAFT_313917 [Aspergillus campestris IBT 28561]
MEDNNKANTHRYHVRDWDSRDWKKAWKQLLKDVPNIIKAANIPVCGPKNEGFTGPIATAKEGIYVNGIGADAQDPLCIRRDAMSFSVCTGGKPYDLVVGCVLLRAYLLAPGVVELRSDGRWDGAQWMHVRQLYHRIWPHDRVWCPWDGQPLVKEVQRRRDVIPKAEALRNCVVQ